MSDNVMEERRKFSEMQVIQAVTSEKINRIESDLEELGASIRQLNLTLTEISVTLSEAKGGWRMLLAVAGASAALGSGIVYLVHLFGGK
jgi:predicted secreted protein